MIDLEELANDPSRKNPTGKSGIALTLSRVANVLRYYRTSQIAGRVLKTIRNRIARPVYRIALEPDAVLPNAQCLAVFERLAEIRRPRVAVEALTTQADLRKATFTLLRNCQELGLVDGEIAWQRAETLDLPHLWRFHLHYHEYLLEMVLVDGATAVDWRTVQWCIESWLNCHPVSEASPAQDAWHPYCISRRLPVWLLLLGLSSRLAREEGDCFDAPFRERLLNACYVQAHFLAQHLEFDLGGNHLLENVTTLAMAALFLDASSMPDAAEQKRWLETVHSILKRELPKQILQHGEHFERTPAYHSQLLGNLLVLVAVSADRSELPELGLLCRNTSKAMYEFLARTTYVADEIPLFGDSAQGESWTVVEIRELANLANVEVSPADGDGVSVSGPYWVSQSSGDRLIFDAGQAMAAELPAHGHCDMLNVVISIGGRSWIDDSGVYNYENDGMRRFCRSSLAHNVATVDDADQCDTWSKFRMGFRGHVEKLETTKVDASYERAECMHNGYRKLGVPCVRRTVVAYDRLSDASQPTWGCIDRATGNRVFRFTGRLHLAPGLRCHHLGDDAYRLEDGVEQREIHFAGCESTRLVNGWHCPTFGHRTRSQVIEYFSSGPDAAMGWVISTMGVVASVRVDGSELVCELAGQAGGR